MANLGVNAGSLKDVLIKNLPGDYPKAGFTTVGQIRKLGGEIISSPSKNNPFHALVNGLNAQQLNNIFKIEKLK